MVKLYSASSADGQITPISATSEIAKDTFTLSGLTLQINIISRSDDGNNQCDEVNCLVKGYSCCLSGQCVNDGVLRPLATAHPDYSQAIADVAENSINYIKWPEIYYVCPGDLQRQFTSIDDRQAQAHAIDYLKRCTSVGSIQS
jgi:hypothetical protein